MDENRWNNNYSAGEPHNTNLFSSSVEIRLKHPSPSTCIRGRYGVAEQPLVPAHVPERLQHYLLCDYAIYLPTYEAGRLHGEYQDQQ